MTVLDTILASLRGDGLTADQAAGVAGNLQVESRLDPTAYNPTEGAIGIAQWEGGRRQELQQFASQQGSTETDLATQLAFLGNELHGSEGSAFQHLLATSDPGSAAAAFDQYYERSSGSSRATRIADAQAIAAGQPVGTGGGSATAQPAASMSGSGGQSIAAGVGGWMGLGSTFFTIGVKTLGAAAAAGLVIVGAVHTISN